MKILHISTHMGGGVGHAISDLVTHDKNNAHMIVLLQKPEKTKYIDLCMRNRAEVFMECSIDKIADLMSKADVVILHWWHHPVMCRFLYDFPSAPIRLVLWSHISGCTYPMISHLFANKFSKVFFTSQYSLENVNWSEEEREKIRNKSSIVYGLGELSLMQQKCDYSLKNDKLKVGYIGTLAKSKIHPKFPAICKEILNIIPNAEFYLIGDMESGIWMRDELQTLEIADKVHFEGYADNVNEWLTYFDIFGYPLNPYHFGTTENSILEAMSAGLPVVLLNQATEKNIVTHNEDGILAEGIDDYAVWMARLADNEQFREKLGRNAAKSVYKKFSFQKNIECFQKEMNEIVKLEQLTINFRDVLGNEPYDWFLSAVSEEDKDILLGHKYDELQPIFMEKAKSSIPHFTDSYPEDKMLSDIKKLWNTRGEENV